MAIIIPMKTAFHDLTMAAGGDYGIGLLGDFLMLVLIAPVTEELLYRGVLFPLAERRSGFWPAAIMNAMVFAAAHYPDVGNMVTASMCIVECALQSITGRTRYGIMLHMIFNCLNIPLAIIEPSLSPVAGIAAIVVAWTTHILFCVKRDAVAQRLIPGWMGCPPRADTPEGACC